MADSVYIVRTGTANIASVVAAMVRLGREPRWVSRPEEIESADRLILPGVGAFGAVASGLRESGYWDRLRERLAAGRQTLCVCLGLQLLCDSSEETEGERGMGVLGGHVKRFPIEVRTPQLGWNWVEPASHSSWMTPGYAYFANSYCLQDDPGGDWAVAWAEHEEVKFVAAASRGKVLACQFHPELSGEFGHNLLRWWLTC